MNTFVHTVDKHDYAASVIAAPFRACSYAFQLTQQILAKLDESVTSNEEIFPKTATDKHTCEMAQSVSIMTADAVHMTNIDDQEYKFYFYRKAGIRIKAKNGKTALFSRENADMQGVPLTFAEAEKWVRLHRETLFNMSSQTQPEEAKPVNSENTDSLPVHSPALKKETSSQVKALPEAPFTGEIMEMKEVIAVNQKGKEYQTYMIRLRNEEGIEKDFFGEHLAEIRREKNLEQGQTVKLQKVDRSVFTILVKGKTETWTKNIFTVSVLKNA